MTAKTIKKRLKNKLKGLEEKIQPPAGFDSWDQYVRITEGAPPAPYKSWLEFRLSNILFRDCAYEPDSYSYHYEVVKFRRYTPDFVDDSDPGFPIWYEVKGRFRTADEADKYKHIRKSWPFHQIVFVFEKPGYKFPGSRKRKDGTYRTQEEWAEQNGFEVMFEDDFIEEFINAK